MSNPYLNLSQPLPTTGVLTDLGKVLELIDNLTHIFREMRSAQIRLAAAKRGTEEYQNALIDARVREKTGRPIPGPENILGRRRSAVRDA